MFMLTESQIAAALDGKFFRGPSEFGWKDSPVEKIDVPPEPLPAPHIDADRIISVVFETYGVEPNFKPGKGPGVYNTARQHAAWMLRKLHPKKMSLRVIAAKLGYSDHSCALYAIRGFEEQKERRTVEIEAVMEELDV
jgi:chromosomal replication initiation ATPase DnaA